MTGYMKEIRSPLPATEHYRTIQYLYRVLRYHTLLIQGITVKYFMVYYISVLEYNTHFKAVLDIIRCLGIIFLKFVKSWSIAKKEKNRM